MKKRILFFLLLVSFVFVSCATTLKTSKVQKKTDEVVSVTSMAAACLQAQTASKEIGGNPAFCKGLLDLSEQFYGLELKKEKLQICSNYFVGHICFSKIYDIDIDLRYKKAIPILQNNGSKNINNFDNVVKKNGSS